MTTVFVEAIPLDMLDDHLKAILRLKLREFLHLDPCMRDIPSINPEAYLNKRVADSKGYLMVEREFACPNKLAQVTRIRRRAFRALMVAR